MDSTDVEISQETTVNIPEHEILLSFNSDYYAEEFYEWWESFGQKEFIEHINEKYDEQRKH